MSLPHWGSLNWRLQDGSIGNLATLYLEEKKITLAANIFCKAGYLQISEFPDFLYKIMDLAPWRLYSLMALGRRSWATAACFRWGPCSPDGLQPPLCLVLSPVSFPFIHHPPGSWRHLSVCSLRESLERDIWRFANSFIKSSVLLLETIRTWHVLIELMWFLIFGLEKVTPEGL